MSKTEKPERVAQPNEAVDIPNQPQEGPQGPIPSPSATAPETERIPMGPAGEAIRRQRKPFGTTEYRLSFPTREGYVRRVFNDVPGRIERAMQAGYTIVKDYQDRDVSLVVDKNANGGGGIRGYLMEIPQEFYDQDFAAKMHALDLVDQTIMRGKFGGMNQDTGEVVNIDHGDRRYGGVKIQSTVGNQRRPMGMRGG